MFDDYGMEGSTEHYSEDQRTVAESKPIYIVMLLLLYPMLLVVLSWHYF